MSFLAPLALAGLAFAAGRPRDVPAQAAARPGGHPVHAPVAGARGRRRGERAVAAAAPEPPAPPPAAARRAPRDPRRAAVPRATGRASRGDLVLVMDTSASMAADRRHARPARRGQGRGDRRAKDLPADGKVSVIAAGRTARVIANGTTRPRAASGRRSTSIEPSAGIGDLGDALGSPRRSRHAPATPRSSSRPMRRSRRRRPSVEAPVRVLQVGRDGDNQAIVALAVRTAPSAVPAPCSSASRTSASSTSTAGSSSTATASSSRRATVRLDPQRAHGRLDRRRRRRDVGVVEVRLTAPRTATGAPDPLARRRPGLGDRPADSAAPDPARRRRRPLPRDRALATCPTPSSTASRPTSTAPTTGLDAVRPRHLRAATCRRRCRATPILAIAPPRTSDLGAVTGTLDEPGDRRHRPGRPDPALRRPLDGPRRRGQQARPAGLGPDGRPGSGRVAAALRGHARRAPTAVMAFEPRRSDLPLQVAFPILLANLTGELMGGSRDAGRRRRAGRRRSPSRSPPARPGSASSGRTAPSTSSSPATADAATVTFARPTCWRLHGDRHRATRPRPWPDGPPAVAAAPSARAPRSPRRYRPPTRSPAPAQFAVDLLDVDESRIAPGDIAALTALGTAAASPGRRPAPAGAERPNARDELWIPIVLVALLAAHLRVAGLRARHARPAAARHRRAAGPPQRADDRRGA